MSRAYRKRHSAPRRSAESFFEYANAPLTGSGGLNAPLSRQGSVFFYDGQNIPHSLFVGPSRPEI